MSAYIRPRVPGASIYFTVCLARRGQDTLVTHVDKLREAVHRTLTERPFVIDAWVVLPDHMHAVWTLPEGDADYATRWRVIKARFSRMLPAAPRRDSHVRRRERGVWQRRFWEHHLASDRDRQAAIAQCWRDPVLHGLVSAPGDWPWTSWHRDRPDRGPCAGQGVSVLRRGAESGPEKLLALP